MSLLYTCINIIFYNIIYTMKKSFIVSFDHNAKTVGRDVIDAVQKCAFTGIIVRKSIFEALPS